MPFVDRLPVLDKCCGCVTDLKTAAAIIAVLGIVTSPVVSWAVVRHAYVIRVSCAITTQASSPDVVDIHLNNALSFGFGANAGLGVSCLSKNSTSEDSDKTKSIFVVFVKYSGWIVLLADVVFLLSSINLISKMFKGPDKMASLVFLVAGLISVLLTFTYGMLYVAACLFVGGSFPVLEFLFAFIDIIIWMYFLCVVTSYYNLPSAAINNQQLPKAVLMILGFLTIYGFFTNFGILQSSMGLFKFLPKVQRFCWCTRSLKCASFMIIIIGMFTGINTAGLLCTPACKELYEVSSPVKLAVNILRWLLFSSEMLLLASIFGFLLGMFYSMRVTADILICTVILKCLISIVYTVLMMIQEQYTHCRWYYSQIFHLILSMIIENCCFCMNLKIGAILIALCGVVSLGSLGHITAFPLCGDATGLFPDLLKYFGYTSLGVNVLLLIVSLIFLIAACMDRFSITATLFLIGISIFVILNLVCLILIILAIILNSDCRKNWALNFSAMLIPLWIYFMIVVRSYKDEME